MKWINVMHEAYSNLKLQDGVNRGRILIVEWMNVDNIKKLIDITMAIEPEALCEVFIP